MLRGRSRFEVYLKVMSQVEKGVIVPSRLKSVTGLSYGFMKDTLDSMVGHGLLEAHTYDVGTRGHARRFYGLTRKGVNILDYCSRDNDFLLNLHSMLEVVSGTERERIRDILGGHEFGESRHGSEVTPVTTR